MATSTQIVLPGTTEYPQLNEIADETGAARVLRQHMGERFRSGELGIGQVRVARAYYAPGAKGNCRLQLRARILDRDGGDIGEQIFCGQLWPEAGLESRLAKARERMLSRPRFGEPVTAVPEWDMLLWAFPNDPEIMHLDQLSQPEALLARARACPQAFGVPEGASPVQLETSLVKYVPARRTAWRIELQLAGDASRPHCLYGKAYRARDARRAYARQRAIWDGSAQTRALVRVAQPYSFDEELDVIFQEELLGRPLSHWLDEDRLPSLTALAGRSLAALHATRAELPVRRTLACELDELVEKGDAILAAFPQYARRCAALRDRLTRAATELEPLPDMLVHGAFRLSHVLSDGKDVSFIDLDGACLGDPAHDLGRFAAHLIEARVAGRTSEQRAGEALQAFVAAYSEACTVPVSEERIQWFAASQLLTGDLYKSVKRRESPQFEAVLRAAEELAPGPRPRPPSDAVLPELTLVIDPARMRALFEQQLGAAHPESAVRVEAADIEKVNYRAGRYCGVLYRLQLGVDGAPATGQWCYVRLGTADDSPARFESARRAAKPAASGWDAVSYWPDQEMIVWAFPADPRLPQLPEVVDPTAIRKLVEGHREELGLAEEDSIGKIRCDSIKHMPAKRTVLRFEIEVDGAQARALRIFSKTYRDDRSARVYRALEATRAALLANGAHLEIPQPLIHIDALHTYWQSEWPGDSMSGLHGTPRLQSLLPLVARALGELHACTPSGLPPAEYVNETTEGAAEDAAKVALYWPDAGGRAQDLAARLAHLEPTLPKAGSFPEATIHGAFRMSQLLHRDGHIALVDYDALARGDPHYDVAELQTSLLYQAFRRRLDLSESRRNANLARQHYEQQTGWHLDDARLAWFESAFVLEKFYLTLKNLEVGLYPRIDEILEFANAALDRVSAR